MFFTESNGFLLPHRLPARNPREDPLSYQSVRSYNEGAWMDRLKRWAANPWNRHGKRTPREVNSKPPAME
jgi:hypothetical protein